MIIFKFKITTIGGTIVDFRIREADVEPYNLIGLANAAKELYEFDLTASEIKKIEITQVEEEF